MTPCRIWSFLGVVSTAAVVSVSAQTATPLETILARAADYTSRFVERFANVVAEEQYEQRTQNAISNSMNALWTDVGTRRLRSDLAIVHTGDVLEWTAFRDVFEVDGQPVRDREQRLARLFIAPAPDALAQARRLADESARYNAGPGERTTNTPELAVLFLLPSLQPRFTFTLGPPDPAHGPSVRTVDYRERTRPTLVRGTQNVDLPSSGRFWIDTETGVVAQSELSLRSLAGIVRLITVFTMDDRFGVAVPVEMREEFEVGRTRVVGMATYSRFRSFGVTTDVAVESGGGANAAAPKDQ